MPKDIGSEVVGGVAEAAVPVAVEGRGVGVGVAMLVVMVMAGRSGEEQRCSV